MRLLSCLVLLTLLFAPQLNAKDKSLMRGKDLFFAIKNINSYTPRDSFSNPYIDNNYDGKEFMLEQSITDNSDLASWFYLPISQELNIVFKTDFIPIFEGDTKKMLFGFIFFNEFSTRKPYYGTGATYTSIFETKESSFYLVGAKTDFNLRKVLENIKITMPPNEAKLLTKHLSIRITGKTKKFNEHKVSYCKSSYFEPTLEKSYNQKFTTCGISVTFDKIIIFNKSNQSIIKEFDLRQLNAQ